MLQGSAEKIYRLAGLSTLKIVIYFQYTRIVVKILRIGGINLRSATRRGLGGPLPHQLANAPQAHPSVTDCSVFHSSLRRKKKLSGISYRFR